MIFDKFTTEEKVKIFNKMLAQVMKSENDSDLYGFCKVAGFVFYEEIKKRIH